MVNESVAAPASPDDEDAPTQVPTGMEGIAEAADALLADDPPIIAPDSLLLAEDQDILKIAYSRIARSCSFRTYFEGKWTQGWTDWMGFLTGNPKVWQSKVFIQLVYEQVSSALPNFVAAIFDSGKLFNIQGRDDASRRQAETVQAAVEHYFRVRTCAEDECEDWVKYALIFGTGVLRASWIRQDGIQRGMENVETPMPDGTTTETGTRIKNTYDVTLENRPELEAVDIWNWFPAPFMAGNGRLEWAFERVDSSVADVLRDAGAGMFGADGPRRVAEWLETKPWNKTSSTSAWAQASSRATAWSATGMADPRTSQTGETSEDTDVKHAQVEYWLMVANDYRIIISGDGTKVLGKMPNPYLHGEIPYVTYCFERIPKSPFGRGIPEIVADIQRQINFNYNKGNDAAQLAINAPIKLRSAGNANVQTVWQPGVIVRLRNTEDMEALVVKNPMADVIQMEAHLLSHADKSTGINDLARGEAVPGANTATEFAGIQAQFRMRMSGHARRLRNALSRLGRLVVSMIQQFVDAPTAIRVAGESGLDWKTVKPSELVGQFDVFSTANFSKSNPALIRQDLLAAAPIVQGNPFVNQYEFWKEFFVGFQFDKPERFLVKPPPPLRNPDLENIALAEGIDVDPSPDEVTTGAIEGHMQSHAMALKAPDLSTQGRQALVRHMEKTMQMEAMVLQQAQMQAQAAGPGAEGEKKRPGGGPVRKEATGLGKAQGSDGPPGQSPGPGNPPGKRPYTRDLKQESDDE